VVRLLMPPASAHLDAMLADGNTTVKQITKNEHALVDRLVRGYEFVP